MRKLICLLAIVPLFDLGASPSRTDALRALLGSADTNYVFVALHQGDHARFPGNTRESILGAIEMNADIVEIDVRKTRDGRFVLSHDQPKEPAPANMLTLEEVFKMTRGRILVNIDKFDSAPNDILKEIRRLNAQDQVLVKFAHKDTAAARTVFGDDWQAVKSGKLLYMPVIQFCWGGHKTAEQVLPSLLKDEPRPFSLYEICVDAPKYMPQIEQILQSPGRPRVWINTMWDDLAAGHGEALPPYAANGKPPRAIDPDACWGWALKQGATLIQTDNGRELIAYLDRLGRHTLPAPAPVPAMLFGQNFEHTRAMMTGGLSAELVRNRKFAGKPMPDGVALGWRAVGSRTVYDLLQNGYTQHAGGMWIRRYNEINSQKLTVLKSGEWGGIAQDAIALSADKTYNVTINARGCFAEDKFGFRVRLTAENTARCLVDHAFVCSGEKWQTYSFEFASGGDDDATLSIEAEGPASFVVGTVSVLPRDNFHGMRRDVVGLLKQIGTSIVRWPGGNFAGDYRWRDGLLPRDKRAPSQSALEVETQTYTYGYDVNDIGTDEILALCDELKAEPFFTLNPVWDKPEGSAEWLKHCKGRVRRWSLGNEYGYGHMEGPMTPVDYVKMAEPHAKAMLAVETNLLLTGSGPYAERGRYMPWLKWVNEAAIPLQPLAKSVSAHTYVQSNFDYTSPARIQAALDGARENTVSCLGRVRELAAKLPEGLTISYDEWNLWYAWFRLDGGTHGVWALDMIHRILTDWQKLRLDCVCYFQAINEGAIRVSPRAARLTSIGEALRLAKDHVGGVPIVVAGEPTTAFSTRKDDGGVYMTIFNPSVTEPLSVCLPAVSGAHGRLLSVADPYPGTLYRESELPIEASQAGTRFTLPPLALAAVSFTEAMTFKATGNYRSFVTRMKTPDGVELYTYGALPASGKCPIVVSRTPYDRMSYTKGDDWAKGQGGTIARGYARVCQQCRGSARSGGVRVPYVDERRDSLALLDFVRKLPCYNGEIYVEGGSYLSSVHWAYLDECPSDVKGAKLNIQCADRYPVVMHNGFPKIGLNVGWYLAQYKLNLIDVERNKSVLPTMFPFCEFSKRYFGKSYDGPLPSFDDILAHPRPEDPFWQTPGGAGGEYRKAFTASKIPILMVTGWYDIYSDAICDQWREATRERKANCALVIDAFDHGGKRKNDANDPKSVINFPAGSRYDRENAISDLDWFDFIRTGKKPQAASAFALGAVRWFNLWENKWHVSEEPPLGTNAVRFAFKGVSPRTYRYDPRSPARFPFGCGIGFGGIAAQPKPDFRQDVLTYLFDPIRKTTDVVGQMKVALRVKSDCRDTAFYVRVSVKKAGDDKYYGLRESIKSLTWDDGAYTPLTERTLSFTLGDMAFRLDAGDQLRIDVSSSNASMFTPHSNVEGLQAYQTTPKIATNTVFGEGSSLTLFTR